MYALVQEGAIVQAGAPRTWFDGHRWWDFRQEIDPASGWVEVAETPRPADTETHVHDRSLTVIDGVPTVSWVQRPRSTEELAAVAADQNATALRADPQAQIEALKTSVAALQAADDALTAVRNLTNAEINNAVAQNIKEVARQAQIIGRESRKVARATIKLARLNLGVLDSAADQ